MSANHHISMDFKNINPFWHTNINEIDVWKKDFRYLHFEDNHKYFIIRNVPILSVIKNLDSRNYFLKKKLFHDFEHESSKLKTEKILKHWMNKEKLIPPFVTIFNENNLEIEDGRHRLNTAYCLESTRIPIVVDKHELFRIAKLLQIII